MNLTRNRKSILEQNFQVNLYCLEKQQKKNCRKSFGNREMLRINVILYNAALVTASLYLRVHYLLF